VVTSLGAASSPTAPATLPPSAAKSSPAKPSTPAPVTYPAGAKAYAEAVIAAWKAKNLTKLADLTTPEVHEQLIEIPGPPNMSWTFVMCDGAAGSQYCTFKNADDNRIRLRLQGDKLGKAHATVAVLYPA
jgi:hypothetical protein